MLENKESNIDVFSLSGILVGELNYKGNLYFLHCSMKSKYTRWTLISTMTKEDRLNLALGKPTTKVMFDSLSDFKQIYKGTVPDDYIIGSVIKEGMSSDLLVYGDTDILDEVLTVTRKLEDFSFKKSSIIENGSKIITIPAHIEKTVNSLGYEVDKFIKERKIKAYAFHAIEKDYEYMKYDYSISTGSSSKDRSFRTRVNYNDIFYDIKEDPHFDVRIKRDSYFIAKKEFNDFNKSILATTGVNTTVEQLSRLTNLSYCLDSNLNLIKDYSAITNTKEFEIMFINALVEEYWRCIESGEDFILSLDTETTGLIIYNLSVGNPMKDKLVAIPIAWRDNQAITIFCNMDNFSNVDVSYAMERIRKLVEVGSSCDSIIDLSIPNNKYADPNLDYKLDRRKIKLIGHNVMFDGKVLLDNGVRPYFNDDTLQMAFNLNPKAFKGSVEYIDYDTEVLKDGSTKKSNPHIAKIAAGVSLKSITHRLFKHETPELSLFLGKGNEGKYGSLSDKMVAIIYGCSDADYTRLVYKKLRSMTTDHMYKKYLVQDVPLLNILYEAEYNGLYMDRDKVVELAKKAESDLKLLHSFIEQFVGAFTSMENKKLRAQLTGEELSEEDLKMKISDKNVYNFEHTPDNIRRVLYKELNYPILAYTESDDPTKRKAKVDKMVLDKLFKKKLSNPIRFLEKDILGAFNDPEQPLIEADKFNASVYPIAYVLLIYSKLEKEYTSYFKPVIDGNMESKIYKPFSMARIETRRIANALQTMKSSLKKLALAYDGGKEYYILDWDMAQVEYRIMVSIAGQSDMVERLKDPEKDFHRESASKLKGIPAYLVSSELRKKMKSVHFGIPYGLGNRKLCEQMNGKIDDRSLMETNQLMYGFKMENRKVIDMLEHHRNEALIPREFTDEFKRFTGFVKVVEDPVTGELKEVMKPVGWVKNAMGFYRLFDLDNLDGRAKSIIRRAAGNYPIQSFAAELFRIVLIRFYNRCTKEGIQDKIKWHLLIHDELLISVHKSLNPFYIYGLLLEECIVTFPGHTIYYIGTGIGKSWGQAKSDAAEAPILFMREMAERWKKGEMKDDVWIDDAFEYYNKYFQEWLPKRIDTVINNMTSYKEKKIIDIKYLVDYMDNYEVRGYITDDCCPNIYTNKEDKPRKKFWKKLDEANKMECAIANWLNIIYKDKDVYDDIVLLSLGGVRTKSSDILKYYEDKSGYTDYAKTLKDKKEEDNIYVDEVNVFGSGDFIDFDSNSDIDLDIDIDLSEINFVDEDDYDGETEAEKLGFSFDDTEEMEEYIDNLGSFTYIADVDVKSEDLTVESSGNGSTFESMLDFGEAQYKSISNLYSKILIKINSMSSSAEVINYIKPYKEINGKSVLLKIGKLPPKVIGKYSIDDLEDLDGFVTSLNNQTKKEFVEQKSYKFINISDNRVIINIKTKDDIKLISKYINIDNTGTIKVLLKRGSSAKVLGLVKTIDLDTIDSLLSSVKEIVRQDNNVSDKVIKQNTNIILENVKRRGNVVHVKVNSQYQYDLIRPYLNKVPGGLISVFINYKGSLKVYGKVNSIDLDNINNLLK